MSRPPRPSRICASPERSAPHQIGRPLRWACGALRGGLTAQSAGRVSAPAPCKLLSPEFSARPGRRRGSYPAAQRCARPGVPMGVEWVQALDPDSGCSNLAPPPQPVRQPFLVVGGLPSRRGTLGHRHTRDPDRSHLELAGHRTSVQQVHLDGLTRKTGERTSRAAGVGSLRMGMAGWGPGVERGGPVTSIKSSLFSRDAVPPLSPPRPPLLLTTKIEEIS